MILDNLQILFGDSISPQDGYERVKDKLSIVVPESSVEKQVLVNAHYDGNILFFFSLIII